MGSWVTWVARVRGSNIGVGHVGSVGLLNFGVSSKCSAGQREYARSNLAKIFHYYFPFT